MADYEADRVVVELLAKADNFDRPIVQSVTRFEGGMDRIAAAATKAEGAVSGSTKRMSTAALQASTAMHRGYTDLGNLLTSDKSPFVIPVKQAPAVASAMAARTGAIGLPEQLMQSHVEESVVPNEVPDRDRGVGVTCCLCCRGEQPGIGRLLL